MPHQPSTLFAVHGQQQPFTLIHEHEAWHVTFPGHRCERFVDGGQAARECGRLGFEKVVYEILPQRYPDAVNALGVHMAFHFMGWLRQQGRA